MHSWVSHSIPVSQQAIEKSLDFCRELKSPNLDQGWPDEKFQTKFKSICREQKPLGPIWIFLDKYGKNVSILFDAIRFKCTIDIRQEIFSIVTGTFLITKILLSIFFLESSARFEGKQNDGIYRCNQQHESKSSGCDFLTIYPTELMIHLEWHACKDQPVDDSFKLKPTDETFTKHPAYKTTGIGMG